MSDSSLQSYVGRFPLPEKQLDLTQTTYRKLDLFQTYHYIDG
jgi:hypothetical protein